MKTQRGAEPTSLHADVLMLSPKLSTTVTNKLIFTLRRIVTPTDHKDNAISAQGKPRRDTGRVVEDFGSVNTASNRAAVEDFRGHETAWFAAPVTMKAL